MHPLANSICEIGSERNKTRLNLFLSSLTFKRPLIDIWKTVAPFLLLFAAWVLLITYVPPLTLTLVKLVGVQ